MISLLRCFRAFAVSLSVAACATAASAVSYPEHPVRIIVPFPAGATMDFVVRLVAEKLSADWGVRVIVENRTGAAGLIGTEAGAKAAPDGYTVLAIANSFAANPALRSDLPYDTRKDFAPVTLIGSTPLVLVAHAGVPAKSTGELVDLARKQPGTISYGAAAGASPHLAMAWFESAAAIKLLFVPYRGQAQAQTDLLGGQVKLVFGNLPDVLPLIKAGNIKAMGIATAERSALAPDIPTLAEAGYKGPEWDSWYGLVAPAATPKEIVEKISAGVTKVLAQPDVRAQLSKTGLTPTGGTPAQFGAFLETTSKNYAEIIKQANISLK